MLWAAAHILARGELKALVFFGTFLVLGALGAILMDRRKEQALGADWQRFAKVTSYFPFLAIAQGRNRLDLKEIGWRNPAIGLALYASSSGSTRCCSAQGPGNAHHLFGLFLVAGPLWLFRDRRALCRSAASGSHGSAGHSVSSRPVARESRIPRGPYRWQGGRQSCAMPAGSVLKSRPARTPS